MADGRNNLFFNKLDNPGGVAIELLRAMIIQLRLKTKTINDDVVRIDIHIYI